LQVFRVGEGITAKIRTLSLSYGGLMTHWRGGRSVYCDPSDCKICKVDANRTWKGYFAGEVYDPAKKWWMPFVVELTEASELDLRHRFERGQTWTFSRAKQQSKKRTPVRATLLEFVNPESLPNAFDFLPVLRTMYHSPAVELSTENPVPDRIFVEPTAGDAPGSTLTAEVSPSPVEFRKPAESVREGVRRQEIERNGRQLHE
jgi:hypothetical protein